MPQSTADCPVANPACSEETPILRRVAIVADYREEGWTSMDLCADMLLDRLARYHGESIHAERVCPPFRRVFGHLPGNSGSRRALNADRALNRYWLYPRHARTRKASFDLFHVIDHSYAQLVHALPAERTVVTCNDLDAFQCLFQPDACRRSFLFRAITRRILAGLKKAAYITCISEATRQGLLAQGVGDPDRIETVHLGVDSIFSAEPDPAADAEATRLIGPLAPAAVDLLHVGSTIPRKRIDVLLNVFASLRRRYPQARLLRVGGRFESHQREQAKRLEIDDAILVLPFLAPAVLAAVYRRAAVVLQPSENEGFGLPLVEAMACGTPVVASRIPALTEVGDDAVEYCEVANVGQWSAAAGRVIREKLEQPVVYAARQQAARARAAWFSWDNYAAQMASIYARMAAQSRTSR